MRQVTSAVRSGRGKRRAAALPARESRAHTAHCGSPLIQNNMSDALTRLRPALADRYIIDREIGAGGMATVYLAQDIKHRRKVALKVLRPELGAVLGTE